MALEHRLDDAYLTLRELGYDEAAFDFDFMPGLAAKVATAGAAVVVTCNDIVHKLYDASRDSSWPQEFCEDVRDGFFGPPPDRNAAR